MGPDVGRDGVGDGEVRPGDRLGVDPSPTGPSDCAPWDPQAAASRPIPIAAMTRRFIVSFRSLGLQPSVRGRLATQRGVGSTS